MVRILRGIPLLVCGGDVLKKLVSVRHGDKFVVRAVDDEHGLGDAPGRFGRLDLGDVEPGAGFSVGQHSVKEPVVVAPRP